MCVGWGKVSEDGEYRTNKTKRDLMMKILAEQRI